MVEFKPMIAALIKQKVVHSLTCPRTSKQNKVVECKHRRIIERGLVLLSTTHMPIQFWPYAIQMVAFCSISYPRKF